MKESGGDDPIRTDGASRWHFALAVRRLGPIGHVSSKPLVGMERFELSRAKALASKTSVSPISTTSPRLSNSQQLSYAYSVQVLSTKPVDINRGLPRLTLKKTQPLRVSRLPVPPGAHKTEAPRFLEGLGGHSELNLKSAAPLRTQQIAE